MGAVINHLQNKTEGEEGKDASGTRDLQGQQRNKRPTWRYVRNKGNARLDTIDKQILTLALR
jgi:hypothetical protein